MWNKKEHHNPPRKTQLNLFRIEKQYVTSIILQIGNDKETSKVLYFASFLHNIQRAT